MVKLKAIIIDDEYYARVNLKTLLNNNCPEVEVIGKTGSITEAKNLIYELNPDVLFLDINMPKLNGFEFLESLSDKNFMVVFVTAYQEYGIKAVKVNAVDYLLKPVSIKELQQSVKKLMEIKSKTNSLINGAKAKHDKIVISQIQGYTIIDVVDIVKLEANDNYTLVFLKDKSKITASKTLKHFELMLPDDEFIRVNRSEVISIKYMKEISYIDGGSVVLKDGTTCAISKGKVQDIVAKVKEHSSIKI